MGAGSVLAPLFSPMTFRIPVYPAREPFFSHQLPIYQYALAEQHPAILAEMRLGKTKVIIRWSRRLSLRRNLVVAPMDAVESWETELRAEGERLVKCYQLDDVGRASRTMAAWEASGRVWLLTSYQSLAAMGERIATGAKLDSQGNERTCYIRDIPDIAWLPWDSVILDESTKIKNPAAQITRICLAGFRNALHRVIATGCCNPENLLEPWSQFAFLDGYFMGYTEYYKYRKAYFQQNLLTGEWKPKPGMRRLILDAIRSRAYVMSRENAGYPNRKRYEKRHVDMTRRQRTLFRKVAKEWAYSDDPGDRTRFATVKEGWLWKIAGGFSPDNELLSPGKADTLIELLRDELPGQVVIWHKFRHEAQYTASRLNDAGIPTGLILGGQDHEKERKPVLEACRAGRLRALAATEMVARYGGNYSFADTAMYYSNEPSCEARTQSEDRIVDIRKEYPLLILDWITRGSTDVELVPAVRGKKTEARLLHFFRERFNQRMREELGL